MALAESWHVRTRSRECAATQRHFEDEEAIVTALFPDPESSGYLRRDYCIEAWEARGDDEETPFSFWRSTYFIPESETKEDPIKQLSPEELLERLIEEDQEHTENTRYILAVMLERKKLLRETDSQQLPNGIMRVYEHRKSGEVYLVRDPNIPLEEVEAVQEEVFVLLDNNGRLPEPEPESEPEAETEGEDESGGAETVGEASEENEEVTEQDEPEEGSEEGNEEEVEEDAAEDAEEEDSSDLEAEEKSD